MSVPLAVSKLVKKISPARAKTAAVRTRTGRKHGLRPGPEPVAPVPAESAELLNVPLSPSAPRKHYANGRPGEHTESSCWPLVRRPEPDPVTCAATQRIDRRDPRAEV